jgi:hypothetical protein
MPFLCQGLDIHEPSFAQHSKMLRGLRLCEPEPGLDFVHGSGATAQEFDDLEAVRFGQGLKSLQHDQYMSQTVYTCQGIFRSSGRSRNRAHSLVAEDAFRVRLSRNWSTNSFTAFALTKPPPDADKRVRLHMQTSITLNYRLKSAGARAINWVVQFRFRQIGDEVLDTNWQVADAATDRVEDSIGDGCLDACGAKHSNPFDAAR